MENIKRKYIINKSYINPNSGEVQDYLKKINYKTELKIDLIFEIIEWFKGNVEYSRLNSPYFPLVRNDIDVINMKSGTCGDYSNLLVSCLINLGYEAKYAYVKRDCYGDSQDHICVAAKIDGNWILIDVTTPYLYFHPFNCPHKEYHLYEPLEFQEMMKKEELYWYDKAVELGCSNLGGLYFAPWIHNETIIMNEDRIESVFFLLIMNGREKCTLYATYLIYEQNKRMSPIRLMINQDDEVKAQFCNDESLEIWDENRWGDEFQISNIASENKTEEWYKLISIVENKKEPIKEVIYGICGGNMRASTGPTRE